MAFLEHFRAEEKVFVERVIEWTETVKTRYQPRITPFLDPREQFILQAVVGRESDVVVSFFGGYKQAERKRAYIYPHFMEVLVEDYNVELLSVQLKQKKIPFEHRDILGALLGLGIKREKFGDILLTDEHVQIIAAAEIAGFVEMSLQQINRYPVYCQQVPWEEISIPKEEWQYRDTTISSLRLDVVLSELLHLSRNKVLPLIKSGKIKVNWKITDQPSFLLSEGDQLSVKGYGRFLFAKVDGLTKKQKYRVSLGKKE